MFAKKDTSGMPDTPANSPDLQPTDETTNPDFLPEAKEVERVSPITPQKETIQTKESDITGRILENTRENEFINRDITPKKMLKMPSSILSMNLPKKIISSKPALSNQIVSDDQISTEKSNNDNFFDELHRLSHAKSSPIPKLLMLIGLVVLLGIIAFLYYAATSSNKDANPLSSLLQNQQLNYTPVTKEDLSLNLEIGNPDDESIVYDKTVIVSGSTNPLARVVISDNGTFTTLAADNQGKFSKVVDLDSGINQITVFSFDTEGNSKQDYRTIYYSKEKI